MNTGEATTAKATTPLPTTSLPYRSEQLSTLLEVFSLWSSGTFIGRLASSVGVELDQTCISAVTHLAWHGDQRASQLAARLHIGPSAISKLTNRLGRAGLVARVADPSDSRAILLRLTSAGSDVAQTLVDAGDAMMSDIMRDWTDDDRADFNRLLRRFRDDALSQAAYPTQASQPAT
ncbi:MarR family winged helix-turn-helix transcriptional regulator [Leucobacter sp. NPDC058333]|uniref:MarR family winged helix-turn-helix transcriptional regulator n=1 Tax=Leucobacter sp. NPDC058333 TaxID=3346450 RepID=UPI0036652E7D